MKTTFLVQCSECRVSNLTIYNLCQIKLDPYIKEDGGIEIRRGGCVNKFYFSSTLAG